MHTDLRAVSQFLHVAGDYTLISSHAACDDPIVSHLRTEGHVYDVRFVVGPRDIDLLRSLQFLNRHLRHKNRVLAGLCLRRYPAKLARSQYIAWIRE